jgi:16S rRNA (guanine527-N7)-methyltransferase
VVSRETPALPGWLEPARQGLETYHDLLAGPGIDRGLIGPREAERLWDRHILNCAVVAEPSLGLIPEGTTVADVGSGAGLPGLVWAIARPDIQCILVEPLLRRATFLTEALEVLDLGVRVRVERGRAEDLVRTGWVPVGVATARAVAPLTKLASWTLPLLAPGGVLLALKGASAQEEIEASGLSQARVVVCGAGVVDPPTTVVVVPAAQ